MPIAVNEIQQISHILCLGKNIKAVTVSTLTTANGVQRLICVQVQVSHAQTP